MSRIGKEHIMKRTIKAVSAAVVSICVLALNLPFFSIEVFADDDPAPQGPTFLIYEDAQGGTSLNVDQQEPLPPDGLIKLDDNYDIGQRTIVLKVDGEEVYRYTPTTAGDNVPFSIDQGVGHWIKFIGVNPVDGNTLEFNFSSLYCIELDTFCDIEFRALNGDHGVRLLDIEDPDAHVVDIDMLDVDDDSDQPYARRLYITDEYPDSLSILGVNSTIEDIVYGDNLDQNVDRVLSNARNLIPVDGMGLGDTYNLKVRVIGYHSVMWHISWANCNADLPADFPQDEIVTHGYVRVTKIEKEENGQWIDVSEDYGLTEAGGVDENGRGDVSVNAGDRVTFEFIPEHGYQLQTVSANGFDLEASTEINTYIYYMPDTNIHFAADFIEAEDIVTASDSDTVAAGSVSFTDGVISGGSGLINISDIDLDSLSSAEREEADEIISYYAEDDIVIQGFLNIDLYNIFLKANTDNEMWTQDMHELDGFADLTIVLEDPLDLQDGQTVVMVHFLEDGSRELIRATYNATANSITFRTSGFSVYAIAIEGEVTEPEETTATTTTTTTTTTTEATTTTTEATTAATETEATTTATETTAAPTAAPTSAPAGSTARTGEAPSNNTTIGLLTLLLGATLLFLARCMIETKNKQEQEQNQTK